MMTAEERKLCLNLIVTPPRGERAISKKEFLRQFPSAIEHGKLALRLLEDAYKIQNADDLQCALIVGHTFGFAPYHANILSRLLEVEADWHFSHEDVVDALDELRTTDAVEALYRATQWIPKSLEYDDSRALAVKAIWALGKLPGNDAEAKLEALAHSNHAILQKAAEEQLERRRKAT
jgi:hypothetical protein